MGWVFNDECLFAKLYVGLLDNQNAMCGGWLECRIQAD